MADRSACFARAVRFDRTLLIVTCAILRFCFHAPPVARAANCTAYENGIHPIGFVETPDAQVGFAASGTRGYVAEPYGGFDVIDLSDPYQPRLSGRVNLSGYSWGVAASGSFAYATDPYNGQFRVIDATDPAYPRVRGALRIHGFGMVATGSMVYVAGDSLHAIDVSDPDHPRIVGSLAIGCFGVALRGTTAYLAANEDGFIVVDISDPANPRQAGRLDAGLHNADTAVAVGGGIAYVIESTYYGTNLLRVVDVSDPQQPRQISSCQLPVWEAYSIAVAGASLYIASDALLVMDVSNPQSPFVKETLLDDPSGDPEYGAGGVTVAPSAAGTRIYVSGSVDYNGLAYTGWLVVLDAPGGPPPGPIGTVDIPCWPTSVTGSGSFAYVSNGSRGVYVIDATDPTHPSIAATCHTPGNALDAAVDGRLCFVADDQSGLQILDVGDPTAPRIIGAVDTPGSATSVAVSGTRAYIADGTSGLQIIDISDARSPRILGTADTPGTAYDVAVSGSYAYVADGPQGLEVMEITDPEHPRIVGSIDVDPEAYAEHVVFAHDHVYLLTTWKGLYVIDVSDPTRPSVVGWRAALDWSSDLKASRNHLYLSNSLLGVEVMDMSNPISPRTVGLMDTAEYTFSAAASGPLAFVIDANGCQQTAHLYVYPGECEPSIGDKGGLLTRPAQSSLPAPTELRVSAVPSLVHDRTVIHVRLTRACAARVVVYDVAGRLVRTLHDGDLLPGAGLAWDRCDDTGRRVAAGIYWVRATTGFGQAGGRLTVLP